MEDILDNPSIALCVLDNSLGAQLMFMRFKAEVEKLNATEGTTFGYVPITIEERSMIDLYHDVANKRTGEWPDVFRAFVFADNECEFTVDVCLALEPKSTCGLALFECVDITEYEYEETAPAYRNAFSGFVMNTTLQDVLEDRKFGGIVKHIGYIPDLCDQVLGDYDSLLPMLQRVCNEFTSQIATTMRAVETHRDVSEVTSDVYWRDTASLDHAVMHGICVDGDGSYVRYSYSSHFIIGTDDALGCSAVLYENTSGGARSLLIEEFSKRPEMLMDYTVAGCDTLGHRVASMTFSKTDDALWASQQLVAFQHKRCTRADTQELWRIEVSLPMQNTEEMDFAGPSHGVVIFS